MADIAPLVPVAPLAANTAGLCLSPTVNGKTPSVSPRPAKYVTSSAWHCTRTVCLPYTCRNKPFAFQAGFFCSVSLSYEWRVSLSKKTQLGRPCKSVLNESIRLRISHVPPPAIAATPVPNPTHPHEAVFVSLYAPPAYPGMLWDPFPRPTCVGHAWVGLGACRGPSWVHTVKNVQK